MSARVKAQQGHHSDATAQHHAHAIVSISGDVMAASSAYDADGQRVMTTQPDGTIIYTPFPDYELTDPPAGADTVRTTYRLGGQIVAVQTKVGTAAGVFYFTYTDHLGNISAMSTTAGVYVADSRAWYDPFGAFISDPAVNPPDVTPVPSSNPAISNHGFTGHRHNNTGTNNLGLIYMNVRYYLPEIGRFISPDTIVPEPANPQSYNRYSYALNSPTNYTDPTGHCTSNYDTGSQEMETCLSAWNSVANYLFGAAFGPGGSGYFPNELISDWLANADIGTLENLMKSYGIGYGYTYTPPAGYSVRPYSGAMNMESPEARAEMCQYWQSCYQPATDYYIFTIRLYGPVAFRALSDDFGNLYVGVQFSTMPGVSLFRGDANFASGDTLVDLSELPVNLRENALQESLVGAAAGFSGGFKGLGGSWSGNLTKDRFYEAGIATKGLSVDLSYTWLIFDSGITSP